MIQMADPVNAKQYNIMALPNDWQYLVEDVAKKHTWFVVSFDEDQEEGQPPCTCPDNMNTGECWHVSVVDRELEKTETEYIEEITAT